MVYSITVEVERLPEKDVWDGEWIPIETLQPGRYVAEMKFTDASGEVRLWLDTVDDDDLTFAHDVAHLSRIYASALAWRQALLDTNGVAVAENALMAALEGRTLKTKDVLQ